MSEEKEKKKTKEPSSKMGRPSNFNDSVAGAIIALFKDGKTESQVSEILGIHINTLKNWKKLNPDFMAAAKEAKNMADELVEAALFTRAIGYAHKDVKIMSYEGVSFEHEYIKQVEPDPNAAQFWLRNRQPDKWREKSQLDIEAKHIQIVIDKEDEKL